MASATTRPLAERLVTAFSPCRDVDAVARAVFRSVAAEVPYVFACLATVDPATGLITKAIKSSPLDVGDEEFAATEYGDGDLNQFVEIARRPVPVGALSFDTAGRPALCRRFREFMAPRFGFTDELRVACRAGEATWGLLGIYRGAGDRAFTADEAQRLGAVHELVAAGLRAVLFSEVDGPACDVAPTVAIVDASGRVSDSTAAADAAVAELGGYDHDALPASVLAVVTTARSSAQPSQSRVRGRSGRWWIVRAMPLGASAGSVALTIDAAPAADLSNLRIAARGLTAREQDVARLVLQGASTKDISSALHLSPYTVQDHLKAIFSKLGVSSRRQMLAELALD